MTVAFQPHLIRRDSNVPLRMMTIGWIIGIVATIVVGPVANRFTALLGFTLLTGGLIAVTLYSTRMWRMLIGITAGAAAVWIGYRFAFDQRLVPAIRNDPLDVLDRAHLAAITVGGAVMTIGLGGVLEAIRAQAEPGESPLAVRLALIIVAATMVAVLASLVGVSGWITALLTLATLAGLSVVAWLRRERPESDFQPSP